MVSRVSQSVFVITSAIGVSRRLICFVSRYTAYVAAVNETVKTGTINSGTGFFN